MGYPNVNFDFNRTNLTGIPEVVLAEPKTIEQLIEVLKVSTTKSERLLITRVRNEQIKTIREFANSLGWNLESDNFKRTIIIAKNPSIQLQENPRVAVVSAGTSDQYVVEEIRLAFKYFGIKIKVYTDSGVAGLHRHQKILEEIKLIKSIKVLIVVAGQDGALFPVITAQTSLPVIAVPTEVGYGLGGKGVTALYTALQSCSPGIGVVNIGNGFGAASLVFKMLKSFE